MMLSDRVDESSIPSEYNGGCSLLSSGVEGFLLSVEYRETFKLRSFLDYRLVGES